MVIWMYRLRGYVVNLLHFKYAVEISKTKSISKAAENLYMGQPNLSRAIKELEEHLGITIFRRTSRGIFITPEGEEFLRYARRIISQVEEVEEIYRNGKKHKQQFSVCVPRACYISYAFANFSQNIKTDSPAEIFYKETNSVRTINNVVKEDYNLGIVRYQSGFDQYFKNKFIEKKLEFETITEFSYLLLMSKKNKLASSENIELSDLSEYIEISHSDPYVPSMPLIEVKKSELSEFVDKRIFIFERASQFTLLETVPNTFMWVSPVPEDLLKKYNLVQRTCNMNEKIYKDVMIHRKGYKLSQLDKKFIEEVNYAKCKYL